MSRFAWDHIHLKTSDPEKMAQWFEKMFGAELIRSIFYGKPRVDVKIGDAYIFIADSDSSHNPAPQIPYHGLEHFGLAVTGIDEIAADLKAKGCEFTREPTTMPSGVRLCFLRGPEGISIELLDRSPAK
jgi:catechol 2,3-dioxygenase-like lactoylglutathione lyase family enzyme